MHGSMESDERQLGDHDRQVPEHVDRTCFFLQFPPFQGRHEVLKGLNG
jgi:hypothetical protein